MLCQVVSAKWHMVLPQQRLSVVGVEVAARLGRGHGLPLGFIVNATNASTDTTFAVSVAISSTLFWTVTLRLSQAGCSIHLHRMYGRLQSTHI